MLVGAFVYERYSFIRPLNLIMFQSAGERLNAIISFVLSRVKRFLGFRRHKVSGFELIAVEFGMTTIVILGGSLVFCEQEKWTYFEAIYYSFVTFWTIGKRSFSPARELSSFDVRSRVRWFRSIGQCSTQRSITLLALGLLYLHHFLHSLRTRYHGVVAELARPASCSI